MGEDLAAHHPYSICKELCVVQQGNEGESGCVQPAEMLATSREAAGLLGPPWQEYLYSCSLQYVAVVLVLPNAAFP